MKSFLAEHSRVAVNRGKHTFQALKGYATYRFKAYADKHIDKSTSTQDIDGEEYNLSQNSQLSQSSTNDRIGRVTHEFHKRYSQLSSDSAESQTNVSTQIPKQSTQQAGYRFKPYRDRSPPTWTVSLSQPNPGESFSQPITRADLNSSFDSQTMTLSTRRFKDFVQSRDDLFKDSQTTVGCSASSQPNLPSQVSNQNKKQRVLAYRFQPYQVRSPPIWSTIRSKVFHDDHYPEEKIEKDIDYIINTLKFTSRNDIASENDRLRFQEVVRSNSDDMAVKQHEIQELMSSTNGLLRLAIEKQSSLKTCCNQDMLQRVNSRIQKQSDMLTTLKKTRNRIKKRFKCVEKIYRNSLKDHENVMDSLLQIETMIYADTVERKRQ